MGKGMASRIASEIGSCQLVVWNRTATVAADFASRHGSKRVSVAATPADVVKSCDVTYSMLSTLEASHAVVGIAS